MAVDITVPSVGESITEGTLARWLKRDGDVVQVGQHEVMYIDERAPRMRSSVDPADSEADKR